MTFVGGRSNVAQPVKELNQHSQSLLLVALDYFAHLHFAHTLPFTFCLQVIRELEVLVLDSNGVVEDETRSVVEKIGN